MISKIKFFSLSEFLTQKIVLLLLIFVLPLNILSLGGAYIIISEAEESIMQANGHLLSSFVNRLDERISNTNYILYDLMTNDENIRSMQLNPSGVSYQIARHKFIVKTQQSLATARAADALFLEIEEAQDLIISSTSSVNPDALRDYLTSSDSNIWQIIWLEETPFIITCLAGTGCQYGAVINIENLMADLDSYLDYQQYQLEYTSSSLFPEPRGMVSVSRGCQNCHLYLHLLIPHIEIIQSVSYLKWGFLILLILYIALIPLLYYFLKKWVLSPLHILNLAHSELKGGNQDYRISCPVSSREFEAAFDSFNDMAESLQTLTLEKIDKELAYKQMLLTNLQLQIRPHFLLNTFNLLYTLIQTRKNEAAQKMILYLSDYFRYLFQYAEDLELFQKEYQLCCRYLDVIRLQSPDAFTFTSQIDPEIEYLRIPPLLLHNFIENIISHALVPGRVVHIMFCAFYANKTVTFQIADDGCGMVPEDVEQINHGCYSHLQKGKHLGIRNSITRLKYFYQDQATIMVESTLNEGTTFTITFPYDLDFSDEPVLMPG